MNMKQGSSGMMPHAEQRVDVSEAIGPIPLEMFDVITEKNDHVWAPGLRRYFQGRRNYIARARTKAEEGSAACAGPIWCRCIGSRGIHMLK